MPGPVPQSDEPLDDRRTDLGLQWIEVARLAGIGVKTLDRVRKGGGSKLTQRAVERALRLEPGNLKEMAEGGPIKPLGGPEPRRQRSHPATESLIAEFVQRKKDDGEAIAIVWLDAEIARLNAESRASHARQTARHPNGRRAASE